MSDRLRLREHRAGDLDDLTVFHGDEQVTRHTPWPVRDRDQTREALTRRIGQLSAAATGEAIVLALEERATGTVIGEALLLRQGEADAALGYALRRDRWGQGLATEAAGTLVDAGFDRLGLQRVTAVVVPENVASSAVLRKLGFALVSQVPDHVTFELTDEGRRTRQSR